jgi:hypothetical protein
VLLEIVYALTWPMLGLGVVLSRANQATVAGILVLRHENAVLRRRVSLVRYEAADRAWFTGVGPRCPRRPATLLDPRPEVLLEAPHELIDRVLHDLILHQRLRHDVDEELPATACSSLAHA